MGSRTIISIKGIVIAAEWGVDGGVTAVDVVGYDENRYRIANDSKGSLLRPLLQQTVMIHGWLAVEDQRNIIYVEQFKTDNDDSALPVTI